MSDRRHWRLDPSLAFLNHGSFGACPGPVLDFQEALRAQMEADPVRFLGITLESRLDAAREALASFVGASFDDLAFVENATTGVNAVLRSLRFVPGDELLVTDHAYNACRATLDWVAERSGARVVVAAVPFPLASPEEAADAILAAAGPRTRLALLDHVTSPTALVMPIKRLVAGLAEAGVDVLVDGAHAPGMVPLDIAEIGAAYYTGNCHKWMCAPKGAGFLHVRPDRQHLVAPTVISHGANSARTDRTRFRLMFDWTGTADPTGVLSVPEAIRFMAGRRPGGWPEVMAANRALALRARTELCRALEVPDPAPEGMIGSMASVPLPGRGLLDPDEIDPLHFALYDRHRIQVPIVSFPPGRRLVRISAQLYNEPAQYRELARALLAELGKRNASGG